MKWEKQITENMDLTKKIFMPHDSFSEQIQIANV